MSRSLGSSTIYSNFRLSSKKRNDGGRPFYLYELDSALIQSVWKWDLRRHVDQSHVLALRTSREVDDQSICFIKIHNLLYEFNKESLELRTVSTTSGLLSMRVMPSLGIPNDLVW